MNQFPLDGLFPPDLHARAAADCELSAAELAREIENTTCPIRRARLENKHAQEIRNSAFHRSLAERMISEPAST